MKQTSRPVAVVTGGSRGIGAAVATALAADGYDVALSYLSRADRAADVVRACEASGSAAIAVPADASTDEGVAAVFRAADCLSGPLTLLVNNAGVLPAPSTIAGIDRARACDLMSVNAIGPLMHAREAVRRMSSDSGGSGGVIVNISSRAAVRGAAGEFLDYAMSKAAVDLMTVGLAQEVASVGIRVVGVRPGLIDTEMNAAQPGRIERLIATVPLGRAGTAHEVAEAVRWLASPAAAYITGVTLDVSGGR